MHLQECPVVCLASAEVAIGCWCANTKLIYHVDLESIVVRAVVAMGHKLGFFSSRNVLFQGSKGWELKSRCQQTTAVSPLRLQREGNVLFVLQLAAEVSILLLHFLLLVSFKWIPISLLLPIYYPVSHSPWKFEGGLWWAVSFFTPFVLYYQYRLHGESLRERLVNIHNHSLGQKSLKVKSKLFC